jgi:hypothetical protein
VGFLVARQLKDALGKLRDNLPSLGEDSRERPPLVPSPNPLGNPQIFLKKVLVLTNVAQTRSSQRMVIRIGQGKGDKDRYAKRMLPAPDSDRSQNRRCEPTIARACRHVPTWD